MRKIQKNKTEKELRVRNKRKLKTWTHSRIAAAIFRFYGAVSRISSPSGADWSWGCDFEQIHQRLFELDDEEECNWGTTTKGELVYYANWSHRWEVKLSNLDKRGEKEVVVGSVATRGREERSNDGGGGPWDSLWREEERRIGIVGMTRGVCGDNKKRWEVVARSWRRDVRIEGCGGGVCK